MASYNNTFFCILILAIPLALAMPRYTATISFQVTSLEARWGFFTSLLLISVCWFVPSPNEAHCALFMLPPSCWKDCGEPGDGRWCWIQPRFNCIRDSDCDIAAPCYSSCKKLPKPHFAEFKALDAPHASPVADQVTFEKPVTNAVKAVTPRYDYFVDALKVFATNTPT